MVAGSSHYPEKKPDRTFAPKGYQPCRTVFVFGASQPGRDTRESVLDYTLCTLHTAVTMRTLASWYLRISVECWAKRKPLLLFLLFGLLLFRTGTRELSSLLFHEPPRNTRPFIAPPPLLRKYGFKKFFFRQRRKNVHPVK